MEMVETLALQKECKSEEIDADELEEQVVEALALHLAIGFDEVDLEKLEDSCIIFGGSHAIFCGIYGDHQVTVMHKDGAITVQPWEHDPGCCGASCDAFGCCEYVPAS